VLGPRLGASCLEAGGLATAQHRWVTGADRPELPRSSTELAPGCAARKGWPYSRAAPRGAHSSSVGPGCPHLRPRVWTVVLKARQKRQPVSHDGPAQGRPRDAPAPSPRPSKQHPRDCSALSSLVSPQHYGGPLLTNSSQPSCGREIELGWPISRCPRRQSSACGLAGRRQPTAPEPSPRRGRRTRMDICPEACRCRCDSPSRLHATLRMVLNGSEGRDSRGRRRTWIGSPRR